MLANNAHTIHNRFGEPSTAIGRSSYSFPTHQTPLLREDRDIIQKIGAENMPVKTALPFAPLPPVGSFWPLISTEKPIVSYKTQGGKTVGAFGRLFGASRSGGTRYHAAIDLYAKHGDPVIACQDGKIVSFYHFYLGVYALIVDHGTVVINYGEVDGTLPAGLKIGSSVKKGQIIAKVGKMTSGSSMLHFECYKQGTTKNYRWHPGETPPANLLDPTKYLLFLREFGVIANKGQQPTPQVPSNSPSNLGVSSNAIVKNRFYGERLGWRDSLKQINVLLGFKNLTPAEALFAEGVKKWQKAQGLEADGILGTKTWILMQSVLGKAQASTPSASTIPSASSGTLVVGAISTLKKAAVSSYSFTQTDREWLAKFLIGEVGGKTDDNGAAVVWAMFNRFGMFRHLTSWTSFANFLQQYSTTLQPFLKSLGATKRVYRNHAANPAKYPIVQANDNLFYKNSQKQWVDSGLKKVQYKKHVAIQSMTFTQIPANIQQFVMAILTGRVPNPGIGLASEFADISVYFKDKYGKVPTLSEWESYIAKYETAKKRTWVGHKPNLKQYQGNTFFIDNRVKNLAPHTVKVV